MNKTLCLLGSALLLVVGSPLVAQSTIELGPLGGLYRPMGSFDPATGFSVWLPREPKDLKGGAWGGEARAWFGESIGVQIQVVSAGSERLGVITPAGGETGPISARVTTGNVQALFEVLGTADGYRVWFAAGPGLVRHGGKAYQFEGSQTDVAAVGGFGGSYPVAGRLRATTGLTALFYGYDIEIGTSGETFQKAHRRDLWLVVGLNWVLK